MDGVFFIHTVAFSIEVGLTPRRVYRTTLYREGRTLTYSNLYC